MRPVERGICPISALYLLRFALVSYDFCPTATSVLKFQHLGHVTSSVTWQLDQQFMLSYNLSIIRLSCMVTDMEPQIFWSHHLDHMGSRDVIGHVTIGLATYGFL